MKLEIKAGATSQTVNVFIQDSSSTTGTGLTGLAYNSAGLTAYYALPKAAAVQITLATLAAVTSAYSSGGFKEVDATNMPGWYRLDLPDAAIASGVFSSVHLKGATNMAPCPLEIGLVAYDPQDATSLGISRIDAAVTTRLAPTVAARTLDVTATGAAGIDWGNLENPTTAVNLSATNIDVDQVVASVSGAVGSVTGAVGSVTGNVGGNVTGTVGSVVGNVGGNVTGTVGSVVGNVGGDLLGDVAGNVVGSVGSVTGNVGGNLAGSVGSVTGNVGGSVGSVVGNVGGNVGGNLAGDVLGDVAGNVDGSVASVTADVGITQAGADKVFGASGAAMAELSAGTPAATPSPRAAVMLVYMALRNKLTTTASAKTVFNDAGSAIAAKVLSDDGVTYTESEMV